MAKIKIFGDAMVVISSISSQTLIQLAKYKKNALQLLDKETKNPVFAMVVGATPGFNSNGITFASTTSDGFAEATLPIAPGMSSEQKANFVKDKFGYALLMLNTLETFIAGERDTMSAEFATIEAAIEVIEEVN